MGNLVFWLFCIVWIGFRVSVIPAVAETLVKKGFTVNVETDAGKEAKFRNELYEKAGAKLVDATAAFKSGKF